MKGSLNPGEENEPDRFRTLVPAGVVFLMTGIDKFEDHWWYDNVAHLAGGVSVGTAVHNFTGDIKQSLVSFLLIATVWEIFEYLVGERPWDGSMCWDHAMEDTVLDTVMGLIGVYIAAKMGEGDEV